MPFCPSCGAEYQSGVARCTECDLEVVESLTPDDIQEEGTDLTELASFPLASEAEMVQELLEGNGIRTVMRGDRDPIGATSGAAPTTLLVEKRDLVRATDLYDAYFAGENQAEVESPETEESNENERETRGRSR